MKVDLNITSDASFISLFKDIEVYTFLDSDKSMIVAKSIIQPTGGSINFINASFFKRNDLINNHFSKLSKKINTIKLIRFSLNYLWFISLIPLTIYYQNLFYESINKIFLYLFLITFSLIFKPIKKIFLKFLIKFIIKL